MRFLLFLMLFIFICGAQSFSKELSEKKHILYLYSYSAGFPTFNNINNAKAAFESKNSYEIDIEIMDSKEFFNEDYLSKFYNQLKYKIEHRRKYDAVLTSDNNALIFICKYKDSLKLDIPIIFSGVEDEHLIDSLEKKGNYYGIYEKLAIKETIDLAYKLNPSLSEVIAITDKTNTGKVNKKRFLEFQDKFDNLELSVLDLSEISFNEMWSKVEGTSGNKAFLLIAAYQDADGSYMNYTQSTEKLIRLSQIPLYHLWYFSMGQGITGGALINYQDMVTQALNLADKVLNNKTIKANVIWDFQYENVVDYSVILKHELKVDELPDNTVYYNLPEENYKIDKQYFQLILAGILVLILTLSFVISMMVKLKKVQRELIKAKDRAERSDELKSAFLANMSHEIRTPMNSIIGFSGLIRDEELDQSLRNQYLDIIEHNSEQLLNLINDIIDFSKIEAGEFSFNYGNVRLYDVMKYQYVAFKEKIGLSEKNIQLEWRCNVDKDYIIETDITRFSQLLNNLLSNAVKYTDEGKILLGCYFKDRELRFYVSDTGIGVSVEMKDQVFDRFVREKNGQKVYEGTGLGLAISKTIVNHWGGRIWLESEQGKGSTFYFTHPLGYKSQEDYEKRASNPEAL